MFLILTCFLLIISILYIDTSKLVLTKVIRNRTQVTLEMQYRNDRNDYREGINFVDYIRFREKYLGGFVTVLKHDLSIVYSTSSQLPHFDKLPPEHSIAMGSLLTTKPFDYGIYYLNMKDIDVLRGRNDNTLQNRYIHKPPVSLMDIPMKSQMTVLIGTLDENYYILLEKPMGAIYDGVKYATDTILISLIIIFIFSVLIVIPLSYLFTKPILKIKKKAESIANLDFMTELDIKNNDEHGDLAHTMTSISVKLKETLEDLAKEKNELEQANIELQKISQTDSLTQLANRMKVDSFLSKEQYRAENRNGFFSIIMMDIDHFKNVNDTYGHHIGDSVLKQIAEILRTNSRQSDLPGRWGGEEFIVILPDTGLDGALPMAEKIRKTISLHDFGEAGSLTASFGVGEYLTGCDVKKIFTGVDSALYLAKEKGRNRTEVSALNPEQERA